MATKTFLKNINIKNSKAAEKFIQALENAENKQSKIVKFDKMVEDVKDGGRIKTLFK